MPHPRLLVTLAVLTLAWALPGSTACGQIANGKLSLTVYFEYDEMNFASWESLFQDCNPLLWKATDGRLSFGEIRFTKCPSAKDRADIRVKQGSGRASAQGGIPGIDANGMHISGHYVELFAADNKDEPGTLLHELGHYAFGCYDEYKGTKRMGGAGGMLILTNGSKWFDGTGDPATNPWYCVTQGAANGAMGCVMDFADGWKEGRMNFCMDTVPVAAGAVAHVTGTTTGGIFYRTDQHEVHGHACWNEVAAKVGGAVPTEIPAIMTSPADPITFKVLDKNVFVVCIDRSGSMSGSPIETARTGGSILVVLTRLPSAGANPQPGDRLGITSFSTTASTNFGVMEMTLANKLAALGAISGINASGSTAIGDGMRQSLNAILADEAALPQGEEFCSKSIIILSDGANNAGENPTGGILGDLQNARVAVYTIALGTGASPAVLSTIAQQTGGIFRFAASPAQLPGVMQEVYAAASRRLAIDGAAGMVMPGGNAPVTMTVDSFVTDASFVISGDDPANPLSVSVVDPAGMPVPLDGSDPLVESMTVDGTIIINVKDAMSGDWVLTVDGAGLPATQAFSASALGESPSLDVIAEPDRSSYAFPEPVLVTVRVSATYAVAGAEVTARVLDPQGVEIGTLTLFDDGDTDLHGDVLPGDGIYANHFIDFSGGLDGSYTFEVDVVNVDGMTTTAGLTIQPGGQNPVFQVAPFQRSTAFSVPVGSVPLGGGTALLPPGSLQALGTVPGMVDLEWVDTNAAQAPEHLIERDDGTGFVFLAMVPPGVTDFQDVNVDPGADYAYRVFANVPGVGTSPPSDVALAQQALFATVDDGGGGGCGAISWFEVIAGGLLALGLGSVRHRRLRGAA